MKKLVLHIILWVLPFSLLLSQDEKDRVKVEALPNDVNTLYNEFAPVVFQNKLVYVSDKKKDESFSLRTYTTEDGKTLTDLWYVPTVGGNKWQYPKEFAPELLTPHFEGAFTFDFEYDRIYFTQNLLAKVEKGNSLDEGNNMTILSANYTNGEYRGARVVPPFNRLSKEHNHMSPTINPDGTLLFFSSDEPGGFGGYDIYVCEGRNGRWGDPQNLGKKVNTQGDEIFPFAHPSGRLYFSSEELGGEGRFDVFYTYFYGGVWETPVNAGEVINSKNDEYGVYIADDLSSGYFSRKKGNLDIYYFEIAYPEFESCSEMEENSFCYRFYDRNMTSLDTNAFIYEWDFGDGNKVRQEDVVHCFAEPGNYLVQLNVIDPLTGDIFTNQASFMIDVKYIEQVYINSIDTVFVNEEIVFDGLETNLSNFEIDKYYWFFDDGTGFKEGLSVAKKYSGPGTYTVKHGITSVMDEKTQIKKACSSKRIVVIER